MKALLAMFVVLAFAPAGAVAQTVSQGLFVGAPHVLTVDGNTWDTTGSNLLPSNALLFKRPGILNYSPAIPFPLQGLPNIGGFLGSINARIDAVSGGFDWVQANDIGEHAPSAAFGLGVLTFSVTRGTKSEPAGNGQVIFDESNRIDGAAADLFSFILPGSTLAPPAWREVTMRAQDSTEISLFAPGRPGDIAAHDLFLTVFQSAPAVAAQVLPIFTGIYFSVSKDTIAAVPSSWWDNTVPSGATILWAEWDHTAAQFMLPRPFKTYADLALAHDDDVIAAAYDAAQGHLLFGTDRDDIDPLRFAHVDLQTGNVTNVSTYRMPGTGVPISERMGISQTRRDKIDAICALDPFIKVGGTTFRWSQIFAVPGIELLPFFPGTGLSAGAYRMFDSPVQFLVTCFTGWPGGGEPQPGWAVALVADQTYSFVLTLGTLQRVPTDPGGDPKTLMIQMPNLPPNSIKLGLHWAVLSGSLIDIAPPAWIDW